MELASTSDWEETGWSSDSKIGNGSFKDSLDLLAGNADWESSQPQACHGPVCNEMVFLRAASAGVSKLMPKWSWFWLTETTEVPGMLIVTCGRKWVETTLSVERWYHPNTMSWIPKLVCNLEKVLCSCSSQSRGCSFLQPADLWEEWSSAVTHWWCTATQVLAYSPITLYFYSFSSPVLVPETANQDGIVSPWLEKKKHQNSYFSLKLGTYSTIHCGLFLLPTKEAGGKCAGHIARNDSFLYPVLLPITFCQLFVSV